MQVHGALFGVNPSAFSSHLPSLDTLPSTVKALIQAIQTRESFYFPSANDALYRALTNDNIKPYLSMSERIGGSGWSIGPSGTYDLAVTTRGMYALVSYFAPSSCYVDLFKDTERVYQDFVDNHLKPMSVGEHKIIIVLNRTLGGGHFYCLLALRQVDEMVLYSFDSYGYYSLDYQLKDKGLEIRCIAPPVRRQNDNPFCYAYSLMDAHLIQQQIEQKSVAIETLHTRYFEESNYDVRAAAISVYEYLLMQAYDIKPEVSEVIEQSVQAKS